MKRCCSHPTFPDQLSVRLRAEGHDLPIRNRHFDDDVQILVLLVLRLLSLFWFIGDDSLTLPPVATSNLSLQEVHPRRLREELQLEVSNAEVPPGISSDSTQLNKQT